MGNLRVLSPARLPWDNGTGGTCLVKWRLIVNGEDTERSGATNTGDVGQLSRLAMALAWGIRGALRESATNSSETMTRQMKKNRWEEGDSEKDGSTARHRENGQTRRSEIDRCCGALPLLAGRGTSLSELMAGAGRLHVMYSGRRPSRDCMTSRKTGEEYQAETENIADIQLETGKKLRHQPCEELMQSLNEEAGGVHVTENVTVPVGVGPEGEAEPSGVKVRHVQDIEVQSSLGGGPSHTLSDIGDRGHDGRHAHDIVDAAVVRQWTRARSEARARRRARK